MGKYDRKYKWYQYKTIKPALQAKKWFCLATLLNSDNVDYLDMNKKGLSNTDKIPLHITFSNVLIAT